MIYLDTSVALAHILAEEQFPSPELWEHPLLSSRLLEYEVWVRLNRAGLATTHGDEARALLNRVALLEMVRPILVRALEPFPRPVRTLDALHLASIAFLHSLGQRVPLATYDGRMRTAAGAMDIPLHRL
ncbi:MAG: PIN domain-containing protein [Luteitalea sp.]|nr:PIN domain-containing protein [Luteitalea sp.]